MWRAGFSRIDKRHADFRRHNFPGFDNGALMLYPQEIRNYRDWTVIDVDLWRHYWFAMVNRGVLAQPYWWDEQWTISVQHTEADIDKHLAVFEEIAPALAQAQQERGVAFVGAAGH